jgi:hypothetical protein
LGWKTSSLAINDEAERTFLAVAETRSLNGVDPAARPLLPDLPETRFV